MLILSTERVRATPRTDPLAGRVVWTPARSLWTLGMTGAALILGPLTASPGAALLFLASTAVTICAGHSVGLHRLLIHRSFEAPRWVERVLVYLGVLVGMAGPFGMIATHDLRDWAQRQGLCHDLPAHRRGFLGDLWWQMHCALRLDHPPELVIEPEVRDDAFYRFLERTWMWQQLPWAVLFYAFGGWGWVVWGIAVRVSVSLTGHWLIGHLAHRRGPQGWVVEGAAVQGHDLPWAALVTFGEGWHGNHHAFPGSARLGVERGQADPGWWLLKGLERVAPAWDLREPGDLEPRPGLRRVRPEGDPFAEFGEWAGPADEAAYRSL